MTLLLKKRLSSEERSTFSRSISEDTSRRSLTSRELSIELNTSPVLLSEDQDHSSQESFFQYQSQNQDQSHRSSLLKLLNSLRPVTERNKNGRSALPNGKKPKKNVLPEASKLESLKDV